MANKDGAQADTDVKAQWRPSSTAAACTHHCDDYALHHCWRGGASTLKGRDVDKEKDGDTLAKVSQPVSLHLYSTYRGATNGAEFFDWNWQGRFFTHAFICMFIIHLHCFLAHFHKRELHSYALQSTRGKISTWGGWQWDQNPVLCCYMCKYEIMFNSNF